jgi:hypothetical protein
MCVGVPGVYVGFAYRWAHVPSEPTVEVRSWSRVIGGSGRGASHHGEGLEPVTRRLL